MQAFAMPQMVSDTFQLDRQFTFQYVEELTRMHVPMPLFETAGRHALLNDAELVQRQQMPAVAGLAPMIVLCVCGADDAHGVRYDAR